MDFHLVSDLLLFRNALGESFVHDLTPSGWRPQSTDQILSLAHRVAKFLREKFPDDTRIGILGNHGSAVWLAIDQGILMAGMIVVPIHDQLRKSEFDLIISDAQIAHIFVDDQVIEESVRFDSYHTFSEVQNWPSLEQFDYEVPHPADLATIIYTSGSMGKPKGVMLSHENIVSNIKAVLAIFPLKPKYRTLSYLPLSHVFERVVIYIYLCSGMDIYFLESPKLALQHIHSIKPNFFTAVPRILEKVYQNMMERSQEAKWVSAQIFHWAIQTGGWYGVRKKLNLIQLVKLRLFDLLVFRKWRKALGGQVKGVMVGAASLDPHIARVFSAAGIPIKEGYGMTETSPVITCNRFSPGQYKIGTVGIPIPGVRIELRKKNDDQEGEIWVKTPGMMMGYTDPQEPCPIDEAGWLYTGDIGKIVDHYFLVITDRKKNIYKTSSGKYVYPIRIESLLNQLEWVDQAVVVGFQKPYMIAILLPDFDSLEKACHARGIHWTAPEYMVHNPKVQNLFQEKIETINQKLKPHERVIKFQLVANPWSVATGELTPTYKIRRGQIMENYKKEIAQLYMEN